MVVLVCALVLPALTAGARAQEDGKILRVHHLSYPDVVDPQKSSFTAEIDILQLAYEGLTRLDTNQETVPAAAESWEYNDDATQITFHLREGLMYSDGTPLKTTLSRVPISFTSATGSVSTSSGSTHTAEPITSGAKSWRMEASKAGRLTKGRRQGSSSSTSRQNQAR